MWYSIAFEFGVAQLECAEGGNPTFGLFIGGQVMPSLCLRCHCYAMDYPVALARRLKWPMDLMDADE